MFNLNPVICVARESVRPCWGRVQTVIEEMGYEEAKKRYPEYRELLQRMGTEVGRELYGENFWVDRVLSQIKTYEHIDEAVTNFGGEVVYDGRANYVITDVRFPNEANAVQSVGGKIYYAMLLKYAREKDECFPGQQKLAEDIGASERSVRSYQKELEEAGFLRVVHRGLGKTSLYQIDLRVERKGKVR